MKNKIILKLSQSFADIIYTRLNLSKSDEEFNFWFSIGASLDTYCTVYHKIYLD